MSQKSPLAVVKESFGGKDKLVDKLVGLLGSDEAAGQGKDELKKRLLSASNTKLIRLHHVAATVKEKYGSRDKLVAATAAAEGKSKDKDFVTKLEGLSTSQLLDRVTVAERKAKRQSAAKKSA